MPQQPPTLPPTQADWDTATPHTTPSVTLNADWASARPLFQTPPKTTGKLPLTGPPNPLLNLIDFGLTAGGAMLAPEILGATTFLPRVAAATAGASAGHVINETLVRKTPPPPADLARSTADVAVSTALGEGVAAPLLQGGIRKFAGTGLGRRLFAPRASQITTEGEEAARALEGDITPGQMGEPGTLRHVETLLSSAPVGGSGFRDLFKAQTARLKDTAAQLLDSFGPRRTVEEAGHLIQGSTARRVADLEAGAHRAFDDASAQASAQFGVAAQSAEEATQARQGFQFGRTAEEAGKEWQVLQQAARQAKEAEGNRLYGEVDALAAPLGAAVRFDPLLMVAQQQKDEVPELARLLQGKIGKLPDTVEGAVPTTPGHALASQITEQLGPHANPATLAAVLQQQGISAADLSGGGLTFAQARRLRSTLGQLVDDAGRRGDSVAKGQWSQYFKALDREMTRVAESAPGLGAKYTEANAVWRGMKETFDEGILATVAEKDPHLVVQTLIKDGAAEPIKLARQAVGDRAWASIQSAHLDSLLRDPKGGWATGDQIARRLRDLTPDVVEAVYGKGGKLSLEAYARSMTSADALSAAGQATQAAGEKARAAGLKAAERLRTSLANPQAALASAIKPGAVDAVEKLKSLITPEDWEGVKSAYTQRLLFTRQNDQLVLKPADQLMKALGDATPETLTAVYGPRGVQNGFYQFARIVKQIAPDKSRPLTFAIQAAQAGKAFSLVMLPLTAAAAGAGLISPQNAAYTAGTAGAFLLAPHVLTRILMTPAAREWLTTGLKANAMGNPGAAARATAQLVAWLVREGIMTPAGKTPPPPQTQGAGPLGSGGLGGRAGGPPPIEALRGRGAPPPPTPPPPPPR